jgi:hypothetical protein
VRFEPHYYSELHVQLLTRAGSDGVGSAFGRDLFWSLWCELQTAVYADKAGFVCDMLLRKSDAADVASLQHSIGHLRELLAVFRAAQAGRPTKALLADVSPQGSQKLPFVGAVSGVTSVQYNEKLSTMQFTFAELPGPLSLMASQGQAFVALQLVKTMHEIWALKGRNLQTPLYEMMQVEGDVFLSTFAVAEREAIPVADCMGDEIAAFLDEHNRTPESRTAARQLLSLTCAALCVTSYVLGECLLDSVYLLPSGALYQARHSIVDTRRSVRASSAATRFIVAGPVAVALGSMVDSTVELTARAFSVVRKNAWILSSVLKLVDRNRQLDAKLMEIRLRLHGSTSQVVKDFQDGLLG